MISRALFAAALAAVAVVACASPSPSEDDGAGSEDEVVAGGIRAKSSDPCTATFVFLQKDAYKASGRTNELWPPHTTTVLEVSCQTSRGEQHIAPFKENYGTKPGTKDANGNDLLTRLDMDPQVVTTKAPWGKMKALVASYEACGCDPSGFLGLDTIDAQTQGIVEKLMPILTCPDPAETILKAVKEKRFDDAKAMASRCRIKDGVSPEQLAKAAADVEAEVKALYSEHHVCNNNAELQFDLFRRFRDAGDAKACDPHDRALCYGPKLFFSPKREIH
jgi:hypothetical protein